MVQFTVQAAQDLLPCLADWPLRQGQTFIPDLGHDSTVAGITGRWPSGFG
jgi:hypothetical protein